MSDRPDTDSASRGRPPAPPGAGSQPAGRAALHVALLVIACLLLFVYATGSLPLADPEEARCGLVVREMIRSGDWLVPHLLGEPYRDKPAPFFWLAAAATKATGSEPLGGRLVAAVFATLAVLVTYAMARRLFGAAAGLTAGLVLATSGMFLFMARWYRMDSPFAATMWAAVWWFWRAEHRRQGSAGRDRWYGFYLLAAVATLMKGPAGLGLPGLIVAAYFLLSRQYRRILDFLHPGIMLYLVAAGWWYVVVSIRVPTFPYHFFIVQNFQRLAGGASLGARWPGILYVGVLLIGLLPWTIYLPGAIVRHFPRRWSARADRPDVLLLWLAAIVPLLFFSLSATKLVGYILPVFPPLAVLLGGLIGPWASCRRPDRLMRLGAFLLIVACLLVAAAPVVAAVVLKALGTWAALPIATGLALAAFMSLCLRRRRRDWFLAAAVGGLILQALLALTFIGPACYARANTRPLARAVPAEHRASAQFYFWPRVRYSFPFYLDAPARTELPRLRRADTDKVIRLLASDRPVYVVITDEHCLQRLRQAVPKGLHILAATSREWLLASRGATSRPTSRPASRWVAPSSAGP